MEQRQIDSGAEKVLLRKSTNKLMTIVVNATLQFLLLQYSVVATVEV